MAKLAEKALLVVKVQMQVYYILHALQYIIHFLGNQVGIHTLWLFLKELLTYCGCSWLFITVDMYVLNCKANILFSLREHWK